MCKIYNIVDYNPTTDDSFFVDANVWLFLYYPMGDYAKQQAGHYSIFIDKALKAGSCLYTSAQVLSEFVNRCVDNEFRLKVADSQYKRKKQDFRDTALYAESLDQTILPSIKNILKLSKRCPDHFDACDFEQILNELRVVDFNDACHLQIVRQNKWILITHDGDFGQIQDDLLTVVTALPRLLRVS